MNDEKKRKCYRVINKVTARKRKSEKGRERKKREKRTRLIISQDINRNEG